MKHDAEAFKAMCEERGVETSKWSNTYVRPGEMTHRERYLKCMRYEKVDRMMDMPAGYWWDTMNEWRSQGLPDYVEDKDMLRFFGFDEWRRRIGMGSGLQPGFKEELISDDGKYRIYYDNMHVKRRAYSGNTSTMPEFLEYPVKTRDDYERMIKPKLDPDPEPRVHGNNVLRGHGEEIKNRNYVLISLAGSSAGWIRNWMGFFNYCLTFHDDPELMEQMTNDLGAVFCSVAEEIGKYTTIDLIRWWEDIAYNGGPIVPPDFFSRVCGPVIKKTMDIYLKDGSAFAYVDSDGDCRSLIPTWLENGIEIINPVEVQSHMDPVELRKTWPGLRMLGGFNKMVLFGDKDDIKKELLRLKPLVDEGGYVIHIDHGVQPGVSYENYRYYVMTKRDIFNCANRIWDQ